VPPAPYRPGFGFRPHKRYAVGAYRRPPGYYFRQWDVGATLPGLFMAQTYWLNTPGAYALSPPPPGTRWIRVDYDALLVTIATGRVVQVVPNIFY
jgi:Ni/Co efflux regulator RcnB